MRVVVAGATGFIGRALCKDLCRDCEVIALTRDASRAKVVLDCGAQIVEWDGRTTGHWVHTVDGASAVVNLAGDDLASGRWTRSKKASLVQSRVNSARAVLDAVRQAKAKPAVVIQASAIGYYGSRGNEQIDESATPGKGFLADLCRQWEVSGDNIAELGIRSVTARTGLVLGKDGGALPKLMRPFAFYLGGHVGSGRQWWSWISLKDHVAAIRFLMQTEHLSGPFNLTAPHPATAKQLCRTVGRALGRPAWTAVPAPVLRLIVGEMADQMLLSSLKVLPRRLLEAKFEFKDPDLHACLVDILKGEMDGS